MKTGIFDICSGTLGLAAVGLLLAVGHVEARQSSATYEATVSNAGDVSSLAQVPAEQPGLPPAPSTISAAPPTPDGVKLSKGAAEIAQLAQGGLGEEVMLAYISNITSKFNLGSDQIVYLNDLGVSGTVVKAMIQRDTTLENISQAAAPQPAPPVYPNPSTPADNGSYPPAPPMDNSTALMPPYDPGSYVPTDDAEYFYGSLAPYGNWTYIAGAGLCWQPTVYLGNHDWRPYGDRGRWLSTDCGWYWQSDYSWGWAPFHYGRWFNDAQRGWVWSPDRVWGPAWVSWRASGEYCGWAPLPPSARYVPGSGFFYANHPVGNGFEFGLHADQYTFIPIARMSDYAPNRYAVAAWDAEATRNQTRVITRVTEQNHRVVMAGVDPNQVAALAGTEIRRAEVREMPAGTQRSFQSDRLSKSGGGLVIYRPELPAPSRHPMGGASGAPATRPSTVPAGRNYGVPRTSINPSTPASFQPATIARTAHETYPPGSLIMHGGAGLSHSPAPTTAPLPNMNLSYLAHQNSAVSEPVQPTYQPANSTPYFYASARANPAWQQQPLPARTFDGYMLVNGVAQPTYKEHNGALQSAPTQSQSPYVILGRFTAAQHLSGNSAPYSVASTTRAHNIGDRYTAAQQLRDVASSEAGHSYAEERAGAVSSQVHSESHAAASAPAPASHTSSSSGNGSSGKK